MEKKSRKSCGGISAAMNEVNNSMFLVTAKEMRDFDRLTIEQHGTPGHVLMERAGEGAAAAVLQQFPHVRQTPVLIVAGKGNNGGDGFVIARLLKKQKVQCEVILAAKKAEVKGDARRNLTAFLRLRGRVTEVTSPDQLELVQDKLNCCGLVVDALLGTGLHSPVQGLMAALIDLINASGVPVVAVDIPSGLDADSGEPLGSAIQAELTVTFGYPKLGQIGEPGEAYVGCLVVADIGIAPEAVAALREYSWPGNVRELENVIERGVVLARGNLIDVTDLPEEIAGATPLPEGVMTVRIGTPIAEVEKRLLEATLLATRNNKTLTAKLLGIDVRTVARKLERWDEQEEDEASSEEEAPSA